MSARDDERESVQAAAAELNRLGYRLPRRRSTLDEQTRIRLHRRIAALPPLTDEQLDALAEVLVDIRLNPGGGTHGAPAHGGRPEPP